MVVVEEQKVCKGKVKVFTCCAGLVVSNLRGTSDAARQAGGNAEDPETSAKMVLDVLEGRREEDVGKFIQRPGLFAWGFLEYSLLKHAGSNHGGCLLRR